MMRFPIARFRAIALIAAILCAVTTAAAPDDGHLPFPGLGHVVAQEGGYRWASLNSSRADANAQAK